MNEKLRAHFLNFGPRRFVVVTVLALTVMDLLNSWYLKLYWETKGVSAQLIQQSLRSSQLLTDVSRDTVREMTALMDHSFTFFIYLILANNLFFYLFYLRRKLWAQGYVLFYALTASLMSVTFVLDDPGLGFGWLAYNLATIPAYAYLFLGIKLLKAETTDPPKPETMK